MPDPTITAAQRARIITRKLSGLPDKFVRCRSGRHPFADAQSFMHTHVDQRRYIVVMFHCTRCEFERWDFYDRSYNFQFSRAYYPNGYLLSWDNEEHIRISSRDATRTLLSSGRLRPAESIAKLKKRR